MSASPSRLQFIDVFRAITMLLMIFVNDLWSLKGVPAWMEHAGVKQDFLGFSDIIFPCFLFIVGMSVPYAIRNRIAKGESNFKILLHITKRSLALIIMGVFTVNISDLNVQASGISREVFQIVMVTAFFLVWNVYPKVKDWKKYLFIGLQLTSVLLLLALVLLFKGGKDGNIGMTPQWWGILGLIGWTYLITSIIFIYSRNSRIALLGSWALFILLNIADHAKWFHNIIPGGGAFQGFAFAGIAASYLFDEYGKFKQRYLLPSIYLILGIILALIGFVFRNFFIISKIQATPTWVFLCNGIAFGFLALIYLIVELKQKYNWFKMIEPAGSSTLTCYLIPYVYYSIATYAFNIPEFLKTGSVGLLKSMIYALIVIGITALLGKLKIRLKI